MDVLITADRGQNDWILTKLNKIGQKRIYLMALWKIVLAGHSGHSRAGKTVPSSPLGKPITVEYLELICFTVVIIDRGHTTKFSVNLQSLYSVVYFHNVIL